MFVVSGNLNDFVVEFCDRVVELFENSEMELNYNNETVARWVGETLSKMLVEFSADENDEEPDSEDYMERYYEADLS